MSAPTIGILGLGLIGGSIAQRVAADGGSVVGWSRSEATRAAASGHPGLAIVDSIEAVVARADIVVLATPLAILAETLDAVAAALPAADPPTLTDVGSVKGPIASHACEVLPDPSIFVPGHPMAGTEHAGWSAADPSLFTGAPWALGVDEPVDLGRWRAVAELAVALGAVVVPVAAAEHDRSVAVTSHLPHVLAAALAHLLREGPVVARSLAGPSFRSATRVVQGSGNQLGAELALANDTAVLEAIDALRGQLGWVEAGLVDHAGTGGVRDYFAAAELSALLGAPTTASSAPCTREALLALGRAGAAVTGFDGDRALIAEPLVVDR